jgi:hypothetical protein
MSFLFSARGDGEKRATCRLLVVGREGNGVESRLIRGEKMISRVHRDGVKNKTVILPGRGR